MNAVALVGRALCDASQENDAVSVFAHLNRVIPDAAECDGEIRQFVVVSYNFV